MCVYGASKGRVGATRSLNHDYILSFNHFMRVDKCDGKQNTLFFGQSFDPRQEISRRDLRKALERQGVSTLREAEVLVLCDSIDPERRGRMRLSDVRRSLCCGMVSAGLSSEGEVRKLLFSKAARIKTLIQGVGLVVYIVLWGYPGTYYSGGTRVHTTLGVPGYMLLWGYPGSCYSGGTRVHTTPGVPGY